MMRVTPQGLVPVSDRDAMRLADYPTGAEVEVSFHRKLSHKQLALFWSVLDDVLPSTDYLDSKLLAAALKVRLRYVESFWSIGGGLHIQAKSLSDMSKEEFSAFFDAAMQVLATEVVPGLDIDSVVRGKAA